MHRQSLRLGIIGCGEASRFKHLPPLAQFRKYRWLPRADLQTGRARELAAKFGVPTHTTEAAKLIADPEIDAIDVLTEPGIPCRPVHLRRTPEKQPLIIPAMSPTWSKAYAMRHPRLDRCPEAPAAVTPQSDAVEPLS